MKLAAQGKYKDFFLTEDGVLVSKTRSTGKTRVLATKVDRQGYHSVVIPNGDKRRMVRVHILMLETYVGPRPEGYEACHNNDIKSDNRLSNLRWGSKASNYADRTRNGQWKKMKISVEQREDIKAEYAAGGTTYQKIADKYGVSSTCILRIVNGQRDQVLR